MKADSGFKVVTIDANEVLEMIRRIAKQCDDPTYISAFLMHAQMIFLGINSACKHEYEQNLNNVLTSMIDFRESIFQQTEQARSDFHRRERDDLC